MVVPGPRTMTEKNAGSRANNAAGSLRNWLPPALVFAVVLLVMFWRLGSYPPYFNDMVDQGIHMEVNKVFDHADISKRVNWYWKDMHSLGAYACAGTSTAESSRLLSSTSTAPGAVALRIEQRGEPREQFGQYRMLVEHRDDDGDDGGGHS